MAALLLNHLWQSTLCLAVIAWATFLLHRHRARVRHGLWLAASIKLLLPFAGLVALGGQLGGHWQLPPVARPLAAVASEVVAPFPAHLSVVPGRAYAPAAAGALPRAESMGRGLFWLILWGLGATFVAGRWLARWLRIRELLRQSVPLTVAAPIPVRSAPGSVEPGVVGIIRPVLLLPSGIEENLDAAQLHSIVAHELEHVRCADNLTAALHMGVQALLWFYPAVWWLGRRLLAERERACDEAVIAAGCDRETYARSVLDVCRLYLQLPLACTAGVAGAELQQRIEFIMTPRPVRALGAAVRALLAAMAVATLVAPVAVGGAVAGRYAAASSVTPDLMRSLVTLLRQERYAELDQRMHGFQAAYESGTLDETSLVRAFGAFRLTEPALEAHFNAWIAAFPGSYAARVARGLYYFRSAVMTRGNRSLRYTTAEQIRGSRIYLAKAEVDLQASLALDARPLVSYSFLILIRMHLHNRAEARELLDAALRIDPVAVIARRPYLTSLMTRWGGSLEQMLAFMQESRAAGLDDAQMRMLQQVVDDERADPKDPW